MYTYIIINFLKNESHHRLRFATWFEVLDIVSRVLVLLRCYRMKKRACAAVVGPLVFCASYYGTTILLCLVLVEHGESIMNSPCTHVAAACTSHAANSTHASMVLVFLLRWSGRGYRAFPRRFSDVERSRWHQDSLVMGMNAGTFSVFCHAL